MTPGGGSREGSTVTGPGLSARGTELPPLAEQAGCIPLPPSQQVLEGTSGSCRCCCGHGTFNLGLGIIVNDRSVPGTMCAIAFRSLPKPPAISICIWQIRKGCQDKRGPCLSQNVGRAAHLLCHHSGYLPALSPRGFAETGPRAGAHLKFGQPPRRGQGATSSLVCSL